MSSAVIKKLGDALWKQEDQEDVLARQRLSGGLAETLHKALPLHYINLVQTPTEPLS